MQVDELEHGTGRGTVDNGESGSNGEKRGQKNTGGDGGKLGDKYVGASFVFDRVLVGGQMHLVHPAGMLLFIAAIALNEAG